jgi:hypothetical protein
VLYPRRGKRGERVNEKEERGKNKTRKVNEDVQHCAEKEENPCNQNLSQRRIRWVDPSGILLVKYESKPATITQQNRISEKNNPKF